MVLQVAAMYLLGCSGKEGLDRAIEILCKSWIIIFRSMDAKWAFTFSLNPPPYSQSDTYFKIKNYLGVLVLKRISSLRQAFDLSCASHVFHTTTTENPWITALYWTIKDTAICDLKEQWQERADQRGGVDYKTDLMPNQEQSKFFRSKLYPNFNKKHSSLGKRPYLSIKEKTMVKDGTLTVKFQRAGGGPRLWQLSYDPKLRTFLHPGVPDFIWAEGGLAYRVSFTHKCACK